jgi:hypothetical protein
VFSVADELTISGLDPDLRAVVERYAESRSRGRCDECGEVFTPPDAVRPVEAIALYRAGWRDGLAALRTSGLVDPPKALPRGLLRGQAA